MVTGMSHQVDIPEKDTMHHTLKEDVMIERDLVTGDQREETI